MELEITPFAVPPDDAYPLYVSAKRYTCPASNQSAPPEGITNKPIRTLFFLHSTGFHKELWEPTLEALFRLLPPQERIEAWVIECPNHGESAILNERALQGPDWRNCFSCEKYALAAHRFITLSPLRWNLEGSKPGLIGIGHSLGGVAMCFLQGLSPKINLRAMILVEPMLSSMGLEPLQPLREKLVSGAKHRRDTWPNWQQAHDELKSRTLERGWDPRVTNLYTKYALRTHPAAPIDFASYGAVTLCLPKDEEVAMYLDWSSPVDAIPFLDNTCRRLPVHIILGEQNDYIPRKVRDALIRPPRKFASIIRILEAGHLIPHQAPDALASAIAGILEHSEERETCRL